MNGDFPRLTLRQRRLMLQLVAGKRVIWTLNVRRPVIDGNWIQLRTFKPLIAAGLVVRVEEERWGGTVVGHRWGPTPRALQHFRPAAHMEESHCDPAEAR